MLNESFLQMLKLSLNDLKIYVSVNVDFVLEYLYLDHVYSGISLLGRCIKFLTFTSL